MVAWRSLVSAFLRHVVVVVVVARALAGRLASVGIDEPFVSQYAALLVEQDVPHDLRGVDAGALEHIGVAKLGHRLKILQLAPPPVTVAAPGPPSYQHGGAATRETTPLVVRFLNSRCMPDCNAACINHPGICGGACMRVCCGVLTIHPQSAKAL